MIVLRRAVRLGGRGLPARAAYGLASRRDWCTVSWTSRPRPLRPRRDEACDCKRGDCRHVSVDVVDYYRVRGASRSDAQNSTDVAIIDIISKVCGAGANPSPTWIDQTEVTRFSAGRRPLRGGRTGLDRNRCRTPAPGV